MLGMVLSCKRCFWSRDSSCLEMMLERDEAQELERRRDC